MKEQATVLAMVFSLALVLTSIVVLSIDGIKADGPILIGLVGAVSLLAGGIVGNKSIHPPNDSNGNGNGSNGAKNVPPKE
jgi:hypothetical protein